MMTYEKESDKDIFYNYEVPLLTSLQDVREFFQDETETTNDLMTELLK